MTPRTLQVTPEVVKADGQNRIAKTAGQVGSGGSVVVVVEWVAHLLGWHGTIPTEVVVAMTALLATVAAWWTNRARLRGET